MSREPMTVRDLAEGLSVVLMVLLIVVVLSVGFGAVQ